jgi:hypothetical protein
MVWNDTCTDFAVYQGLISGLSDDSTAEASCNDPNNQYYDLVGPVGSSGGMSSCISTSPSTNSIPADCTGGYPKPSWQTGVGVPSDGARDLPDVSLFAGTGTISSTAYAECEGDLEGAEDLPTGQPCSLTVEPDNPENGEPYVEIEAVGGTSASAQAFAGVMALVVQKQGWQGNFNPVLYSLAGGESASSCNSSAPASTCIFNDVITGTNAMPCLAGSINCNLTKTSDAVGVLSGYSAGVGYDQATGLGTVNVGNLLAASGSSLFYLSSANPVVTIPSGSTTGTLNLSAASVNGFSGQISAFTCSGLPSGATCSASPAISLTGTGSTGSTTLTITLASAAALKPAASRPLDIDWRIGCGTLTMAFILCMAISLVTFYGRPRRRITAMAVVAFAILIAAAGCGGGSSSPSPSPTPTPPPTGTYAATVTATASTGSPSFTISFTVNVE